MHRFASPHTSSLTARLCAEVDQISDRTLPNAIAALLWQEGVTADEFAEQSHRFRGVTYNRVWIVEALRAFEAGTLDPAACLHGAGRVQALLDHARELGARRRGRYGGR